MLQVSKVYTTMDFQLMLFWTMQSLYIADPKKSEILLVEIVTPGNIFISWYEGNKIYNL